MTLGSVMGGGDRLREKYRGCLTPGQRDRLQDFVRAGKGSARVVIRAQILLKTAKPESTEERPWGQPLRKPEGAPLNLG